MTARRRAAILRQLRNVESITADQLAERFGVSVRTIHRDVEILRDAGARIVGVTGHGFHLEPGMLLHVDGLTFDETDALIAAARAGLDLIPPCQRLAADAALRRAESALPSPRLQPPVDVYIDAAVSGDRLRELMQPGS